MHLRSTAGLVCWTLGLASIAAAQELPPNHGCVTATAYGATPNDAGDDTQGLQAALQATLQRGMWTHCYLPPGTYLVSNTIGGTDGEWRFFTLRGAGPDKTVIRLKANAQGFGDPSIPKPVVHFRYSNNATHALYVEHLTIEVDSGNAGATALMFGAHNGGGVTNVVLRAAPNSGHIGLDKSETPGPEYVRDLRVFGFAKGVYLAGGMYSVTMEGIHVEGQRTYGVHNNGVPTQIVNFTSTNTVRAIHSSGNGLTLINATCNGGSAGVIAVASIGPAYVRNLSIAGSSYGFALGDGFRGQNLAGPVVTEYVSESVKMTFPSPPLSLGLEIKSPPSPAWDPPSTWGEVHALGGLQAAINAGKSTIYFRNDQNSTTGDVHVNNSGVKRIVGFGRSYPGKVIFDNPDANSVVVTDQLRFGGDVEVRSAGTVVLKGLMGFDNVNVSIYGPGDTHIEDFCCGTITVMDNARAWVRQLNTESSIPLFDYRLKNMGGDLVCIGVKTEGPDPILSNTNGARTDVLGGFTYPGTWYGTPDQTAFLNDNSAIALFHNQMSWTYPSYIREVRSGYTTRDTMPQFGVSCAYVTNPNGQTVRQRHGDPVRQEPAGVRSANSGISVLMRTTDPHRVEIFTTGGRAVFLREGRGVCEYWYRGIPGTAYVLRIRQSGHSRTRTVVCR